MSQEYVKGVAKKTAGGGQLGDKKGTNRKQRVQPLPGNASIHFSVQVCWQKN